MAAKSRTLELVHFTDRSGSPLRWDGSPGNSAQGWSAGALGALVRLCTLDSNKETASVETLAVGN